MSDDIKADGNSRWTRQTAQIHVEAQKKSGLSKMVFCAQAGIDYKKLLSWSRKIHLESEANSKPFHFLPVSTKSEPRPSNSCVEVVAKDGHVVRVAENFDTATLRRVLVALESSC